MNRDLHTEDLPAPSAGFLPEIRLPGLTFTVAPAAPHALAFLVSVVGTTAERPARVLIVDDEVALAQVLARGLRRALGATDTTVETAYTPEEALQRVEAWSPDDRVVVISDYNLGPTLNGIALLRQIQARLPGARCVLMSGYGREMFEDQLTGFRVDAVLGKPLDMHGLRKMVAEFTNA